MTPREAIDELKARAAVVRADFDDTADAADGAASDVLAAIRADLAEHAREMAALEMAIASLEAFGGVDETTLAPALQRALVTARRDYPDAAIVLVGFARAARGGDVHAAAPVIRVRRGSVATVAGLIRRGFLVWGRES